VCVRACVCVGVRERVWVWVWVWVVGAWKRGEVVLARVEGLDLERHREVGLKLLPNGYLLRI